MKIVEAYIAMVVGVIVGGFVVPLIINWISNR